MITIMLYEGAIFPPVRVRVRPAAAFHFIAEGAAPKKQKKNEEYYRREKGARETRELERQGRSETGARPLEENHKFGDGSRWGRGRECVYSRMMGEPRKVVADRTGEAFEIKRTIALEDEEKL